MLAMSLLDSNFSKVTYSAPVACSGGVDYDYDTAFGQ